MAAPEPPIGQTLATLPAASAPAKPVQAQGPTAPSDANGNSLLNDLFRATISYRTSKAYFDLLDYIVRFRRYSPYNCLLVRLQRPTVGYVATPSDWMTEFERKVKPDARPLMMLRPFGPVMFVFDIEDTEGKSAPADLMRPFDAQGQISPSAWNFTVTNAGHDGISVMGREASLTRAGRAKRIGPVDKSAPPTFEVFYNSKLTPAESYVTLTHELAHIYCGHLGECFKWRVPDRRSVTKDAQEFEAESVAYIVCARQGIVTTAPKYLADYLGRNHEVPQVDIHRVLVVASRIEEMGKSEKKAKKQKEPKKIVKQKGHGLLDLGI
jgi:hypothetical protein